MLFQVVSAAQVIGHESAGTHQSDARRPGTESCPVCQVGQGYHSSLCRWSDSCRVLPVCGAGGEGMARSSALLLEVLLCGPLVLMAGGFPGLVMRAERAACPCSQAGASSSVHSERHSQ